MRHKINGLKVNTSDASYSSYDKSRNLRSLYKTSCKSPSPNRDHTIIHSFISNCTGQILRILLKKSVLDGRCFSTVVFCFLSLSQFRECPRKPEMGHGQPLFRPSHFLAYLENLLKMNPRRLVAVRYMSWGVYFASAGLPNRRRSSPTVEWLSSDQVLCSVPRRIRSRRQS